MFEGSNWHGHLLSSNLNVGIVLELKAKKDLFNFIVIVTSFDVHPLFFFFLTSCVGFDSMWKSHQHKGITTSCIFSLHSYLIKTDCIWLYVILCIYTTLWTYFMWKSLSIIYRFSFIHVYIEKFVSQPCIILVALVSCLVVDSAQNTN